MELWGRARRGPGRLVGVAVVASLVVLASACKPAPHGISEQSETFAPTVPWNGVKVYLSAPRHASSGSRGECGWEENINGRIFNLYASEGLTPNGYEVRVSANTRDDGWRVNRDESDNWGANVHLVTHTNAFGAGCGDAAQYLLVMFRTGNANSIGLRDKLIQRLDPKVPGGNNSWNCDQLGECAALAPHNAYIELFFHTNQAAVDWFQGPREDPEATGGRAASPFLGQALDEHLGSPRGVAEASTWPLDDYAGFGRSPAAAQRDQVIAYGEAFEREQSIVACMANAGFDYSPAVAFPAEDTLAVAERLGVDPAGAAGAGGFATNRAYEQTLTPAERERYNQTLLGESAAEIAEADRTGLVPEGRGEDFARGGCTGAARKAIPSIWDTPRALAGALEAARLDGSLPHFAADHTTALTKVKTRYKNTLATLTANEALTTHLATG